MTRKSSRRKETIWESQLQSEQRFLHQLSQSASLYFAASADQNAKTRGSRLSHLWMRPLSRIGRRPHHRQSAPLTSTLILCPVKTWSNLHSKLLLYRRSMIPSLNKNKKKLNLRLQRSCVQALPRTPSQTVRRMAEHRNHSLIDWLQPSVHATQQSSSAKLTSRSCELSQEWQGLIPAIHRLVQATK